MTVTSPAPRYIANGLRELIEARGLRQVWVAQQTGYTRQRINDVISKRRSASKEEAERIASTLQTPFFLIWKNADACNSNADKGQSA